jgi:signal transduction histidine kinase
MRRLVGLTIRTRILAFQLIVGVAVLALFAAAFVAIQNFHYYLARGALAHRQLAAIDSLARDADQYSKGIASLLMTGEAGGQNVADLQGRIATDFETFMRLTQEETDFLTAGGLAQAQKAEVDRIVRMHDLYDDMTRRFEALLTMREAGQGEAAARVFFRDVDRQLNDEFEGLIDDAVAGEIAEVEAADSEAQELVRALAWGIGLTSALVILATMVAGFSLYRSIVRPIGKLSAGAVAIGRGDLSFRVGRLGEDELGLLARRFDEMAARIEEQQKLLLAARNNLEAEVLARTGELETANETLRDRDRSRVRFLADISHELRTPLTVLRGEAEVTLRGKSSGLAAYRETLERIVEQAREMTRLVEDLLTLARSETDDIRFEKITLDLGAIASEAVREADILARPREVRIDAAIDGGLFVDGDPQRMKQVLMIVLDNAVKYSERSGIVHLDASADGGAVTLAVRNTPDAIDEEELPRLFDRFYRGRDAAMLGSGGSGLGLAIARWMVERQGGTIALERDGTVIKVTIAFPAAPSPEPADARPGRKQPVAAH